MDVYMDEFTGVSQSWRSFMPSLTTNVRLFKLGLKKRNDLLWRGAAQHVARVRILCALQLTKASV